MWLSFECAWVWERERDWANENTYFQMNLMNVVNVEHINIKHGFFMMIQDWIRKLKAQTHARPTIKTNDREELALLTRKQTNKRETTTSRILLKHKTNKFLLTSQTCSNANSFSLTLSLSLFPSVNLHVRSTATDDLLYFPMFDYFVADWLMATIILDILLDIK